MSTKTKIQWCDSTVNPSMGCDGCELFPKRLQLSNLIRKYLKAQGLSLPPRVHQAINSRLSPLTVTDIYHSRQSIASAVLQAAGATIEANRHRVEALARAIADEYRCYAAVLHLRHGEDVNKPGKRTNKGYARIFEEVKRFPGRMAEASQLSDLRGTDRTDKPWLNGMPRLIFVSDMSDLLSKAISFEFIRDEVIANVTSLEGQRHIWLWLSKRPSRMAEFSKWLEAQGTVWPDNLVAMTSVTSQKTVPRVEQLKQVRCRFRGLSVEPLWSAVRLPLEGIDWVIVGGESGGGAKPFRLRWAREIREQCRNASTAFFLKQLGSGILVFGHCVPFHDRHGGNWQEWPSDLRIRELPAGFRV